MQTETSTPRLCFIQGMFAYFTTRKIEDQWGDDWNDAPYEHNAGLPYSPCWHNEPKHRNNRQPKIGADDATKPPLKSGELCRCKSCVEDWNEDGTPKWEISKLAFTSPLETPECHSTNSRYSVQEINAGAVAWLRSSGQSPPIVIPAGATMEEFLILINKSGGEVYAPIVFVPTVDCEQLTIRLTVKEKP